MDHTTPNFTPPYHVRAAVAGDVAQLSPLKVACFTETFGPTGFAIPYPEADRLVFEEASYGAAQVAAELADPTHATWVVEDAAGVLAGYAHVGPCKLPHDDVAAGDTELYQLYLRRGVQGAGLGGTLMALALGWMRDAARAGGGRAMWLGVWSNNLRAQQIYAKAGFTIVGGYQFAVGDWRDDEFIMRAPV